MFNDLGATCGHPTGMIFNAIMLVAAWMRSLSLVIIQLVPNRVRRLLSLLRSEVHVISSRGLGLINGCVCQS
jgi:hypothetical protein